MERIEIVEGSFAPLGKTEQAEMLCELGLIYATGRDCEVDLVAAHKWFNIAAVKGSDRAGELRAELSAVLSKPQLARALREAREWMTIH